MLYQMEIEDLGIYLTRGIRMIYVLPTVYR